MKRLSAENLVRAISLLPRNVDLHYVSPENPNRIRIVEVVLPEGPIRVVSYCPKDGETFEGKKPKSISSNTIWRVANALSVGNPMQFDQVLQGGGNARSVFEALLARTPDFYMCKPSRTLKFGSTSKAQEGPKHIWWKPDTPHKNDEIVWWPEKITISELAVTETVYEEITLPSATIDSALKFSTINLGLERRHAEIQLALITIGNALNFKTAVAVQDQSIMYQGKRLIEQPGAVLRLGDLPQVSSYPTAVSVAKDVDIIWFKNGRLMPAAIEIEHTTGILSGLTRLKKLQDVLPDYRVRYVIAAPDGDRGKVVKAIKLEQFKSLNAKYFPYSAIEELFSLSTKRTLRGVTEEFLDSFMEDVD